MDVVLAACDRQQRADAEADCGDGDTELDAAQARHLISKAIASALNSLLGMKPCAGPASIS